MEEIIKTVIDTVGTYLYTYILVGLLSFVGIYFTVRLKLGQLINLPHMISLLRESNKSKDDKESKGISSFKAFCVSAASRIGTGNIVGVAVAIKLGGPGAVFWMWLLAFLGSATAFVESTLAQVYKVQNEDGSFRGGPAYYILQVLGAKKLAMFFAIVISVTYGFAFNAIQANTLAKAGSTSLGLSIWVVGILLALATGVIIFGGAKRVADITSAIVPIMALMYLGVAIFVVVTNLDFVPKMFELIFLNAFGFKEIAGAGIGATILQGVKRGLFSNEAGMGSVPNAAAAADTTHPAKQGFVQALGVYVDTWLVCTATAFIVLLGGEDFYGANGGEGLEITQQALVHEVGSWGVPFLSICVFFFAFSSIIGNYFYGESNIGFLGGSKTVLNIFRALVCVVVFLGCVGDFSIVWDTGDIFMGIMAIVNLVVLLLIGNIAIEIYDDYRCQVKTGTEPVFNPQAIPAIKKQPKFWQE